MLCEKFVRILFLYIKSRHSTNPFLLCVEARGSRHYFSMKRGEGEFIYIKKRRQQREIFDKCIIRLRSKFKDFSLFFFTNEDECK